MATFTLQFSAYPFLDDCMGKSSPTKDGENMFLFGLVYVWVKIYIMRTHFSTNFKSLLACLKITQNNMKLSGLPYLHVGWVLQNLPKLGTTALLMHAACWCCWNFVLCADYVLKNWIVLNKDMAKSHPSLELYFLTFIFNTSFINKKVFTWSLQFGAYLDPFLGCARLVSPKYWSMYYLVITLYKLQILLCDINCEGS